MTQAGATLHSLALHDSARLVAPAEPGLRHALARLGLRVGATVSVVQRTPGGGRVVSSGDVRIAIDGPTARQVSVTTLAGEAGPPGHGGSAHAPTADPPAERVGISETG